MEYCFDFSANSAWDDIAQSTYNGIEEFSDYLSPTMGSMIGEGGQF
jgi:hypothetical protein